jgi:histidine ammonia-lyase
MGRAQAIELGRRPIAIADVVAVARAGAPVRLAANVAQRLVKARRTIDKAANAERAIYGLNTGLGAAVDTALAVDEMLAFQRRVIRARAVGVGGELGGDEVRAMLFVRLAGIAQGASGLSPPLAGVLRDMLNRNVQPRVRRIGTLGEADLSPLAQAFLPLVQNDGLLKRAGIKQPLLGPKDAIALLNSNAHGVGSGALALHDAHLVLEAQAIAGALSLEAAGANLSPIDRRAVALRPAPGQHEASQRIRSLLQGSKLLKSKTPRRVQDPLSFRCLAPVQGAAFEQLAQASRSLSVELNGAGDSPAVLADGVVVSTVNFDTTALALAFEGMGQALSHCAALAVFRIMKLMSPGFSGLPRFLTPRSEGARTGFATVQKTASALEAEIRHLALPVGPMTAPVADGVEDYAPMTPRVVDKTREIVSRLARLTAVEMVVAAQAIDLQGKPAPRRDTLGRGTRKAFALIRKHVARLDDDRPTGVDFERLAGALLAGEFSSIR